MILNLELYIKALPHQSVRVTRTGIAYQPKKIVDYKNEIRRLVREQLPSSFSVIGEDVPIFIDRLHYVFAYPSSFSKKKRAEDVIHFRVTKPDLHDNLNKPLFDAMEGTVWMRDQNVVSLNDVKKYYSDVDKILMDIRC